MKLIFFTQGKVSYHLSENLYSSLIYSKNTLLLRNNTWVKIYEQYKQNTVVLEDKRIEPCRYFTGHLL